MGHIKKIYDSVHRFIHVDEVESLLINTAPFQRLHYIHQLDVMKVALGEKKFDGELTP
ncbi:MAG: hypothetical protein QNJ27_02095 [Simkaniaceae bacterium]|nr:hypothetical protein [Simkaniaceae bacterium]